MKLGGRRHRIVAPAFVAAALLLYPSLAGAQTPAPLPVEESDTVALPAPSPHWIVVVSAWGPLGARIFDGDTGKMIGEADLSKLGSFATDPKGRFYYAAESIWTKGTRGTRQDLLTVRDSHSLKVLHEIPLPGRLLADSRSHLLGISPDGKQAYVYNMDPASSVIVVDLDKNKVAGIIETPGCSLAAAIGPGRAMSLCSDGSLAVSTWIGKTGKVVSSNPFFAASSDPVFDNFALDGRSGTAMLLSYSGLVVEARLATGIDIAAAWSIQEAAGLTRGTTAPLIPNWLPGGVQPVAFHKQSGRLYVLMHLGEFWSQKQTGSELWVLDGASHKLIARKRLENPISSVIVSQDSKPLLFLADEKSVTVLDGITLEPRNKIDESGFGLLALAADSQ